MTGWELAASVQQSIGNFWNLSRSQIYRELGAAEAAGLVRARQAGPRERRPFAITAAGREAFTTWISREPETENIRFPLLLTLYFADQLPPEGCAASCTSISCATSASWRSMRSGRKRSQTGTRVQR